MQKLFSKYLLLFFFLWRNTKIIIYWHFRDFFIILFHQIPFMAFICTFVGICLKCFTTVFTCANFLLKFLFYVWKQNIKRKEPVCFKCLSFCAFIKYVKYKYIITEFIIHNSIDKILKSKSQKRNTFLCYSIKSICMMRMYSQSFIPVSLSLSIFLFLITLEI